MNGRKRTAIEIEKLLAENPKVDRELVEGFAKLERELAVIGVETRGKYSLTPPLGDGLVQCSHALQRKVEE